MTNDYLMSVGGIYNVLSVFLLFWYAYTFTKDSNTNQSKLEFKCVFGWTLLTHHNETLVSFFFKLRSSLLLF